VELLVDEVELDAKECRSGAGRVRFFTYHLRMAREDAAWLVAAVAVVREGEGVCT
jgi:hypothetical protein